MPANRFDHDTNSNICSGPVLQDLQVTAVTNVMNNMVGPGLSDCSRIPMRVYVLPWPSKTSLSFTGYNQYLLKKLATALPNQKYFEDRLQAKLRNANVTSQVDSITTSQNETVTSQNHLIDEESIFSLNFPACSKEQSKEQNSPSYNISIDPNIVNNLSGNKPSPQHFLNTNIQNEIVLSYLNKWWISGSSVLHYAATFAVALYCRTFKLPL